MSARALTAGETMLARCVFGAAIDYSRVTIRRGKWAFFQPRETVMAPLGHIHFHPRATRYHDDFSRATIADQGLFLHEMVHVWQHQRGLFLPLVRHPFCRYRYTIRPGWPLSRYGIEQQGEIVRHGFLLRHGLIAPGVDGDADYEALMRFD